MTRRRIGVNLCRIDLRALHHADHAILDSLGAVARRPAPWRYLGSCRSRPGTVGATAGHGTAPGRLPPSGRTRAVAEAAAVIVPSAFVRDRLVQILGSTWSPYAPCATWRPGTRRRPSC